MKVTTESITKATSELSQKRLKLMNSCKKSFFMEAYRDDKHVLSILCDAHPKIRVMAIVLAGFLRADTIVTMSDSYVRKSGFDLSTYERGSLSEAFENNDPDVSEAISISAFNTDSAGSTAVIPYVRGYKSTPILQEEFKDNLEVSGMIPDEIEAGLRFGMEQLDRSGMSIKGLMDESNAYSRINMIALGKGIDLGSSSDYVSDARWSIIDGLEIHSDQNKSITKKFIEVCDASKLIAE